MDFIALDVETANRSFASICQIGFVIFENGMATEKRQSLVDPEDYFDGWNVSIHGITEKMTRGKRNFHQIFSDLKRQMENKVVVTNTDNDNLN